MTKFRMYGSRGIAIRKGGPPRAG